MYCLFMFARNIVNTAKHTLVTVASGDIQNSLQNNSHLNICGFGVT